MGKIRIGLSGWDYDSWKGDFYPVDLPRRRWLEHVGERFDTAEINGSFYSLQKPSSYRSWYAATPPDFRFAVKGGRFITHSKKLKDVVAPVGNFFASGVLALEDKMGPILWQLPAQSSFREERVRDFLELLPRDFGEAVDVAREHDHRVPEPFLEPEGRHRIRHALEARHPSFFQPEAVRVLREAGVSLVVSHAGKWEMREELTAGWVYVRLHGAPHTYHSGYGPRAIAHWAERVRAWSVGEEPEDAERITERAPPARQSRDVYVYFDNDAEGYAPRDGLRLRDALSG